MVFQNYALYPHMTRARQHRLPAAQLAGAERARATRVPRDGRARCGIERAARPQAARALRRPAPARRDGAGDRPPPAGVPDGRAALQPRRQAARADAGRARAAAPRGSASTTLYVTHDQTEAMTLGQRVAVLNARRAQQVDTPQTLYRRPANTFVAGFIGSPSMNFLRAKLGARRVELGALPAGAARAVRAAAREASPRTCWSGCDRSTSRRALGEGRPGRPAISADDRGDGAARPRDLRLLPDRRGRRGGDRRAPGRARRRARGAARSRARRPRAGGAPSSPSSTWTGSAVRPGHRETLLAR